MIAEIGLVVVAAAAIVLAAYIWSTSDEERNAARLGRAVDQEAMERLIALVLDDLKASRRELAVERAGHVQHLTTLLAAHAAEREKLLQAALDHAAPFKLASLEITAEQNTEIARAREFAAQRLEMTRQDRARANERYEDITG